MTSPAEAHAGLMPRISKDQNISEVVRETAL
jgi:hypothetical protein